MFNQEWEHLKNSPIVEAVIAWTARIEHSISGDELEKRLRAEFPDYPTIEPQEQSPLLGAIGLHNTLGVAKTKWEGFRLTSEDGLQVSQFKMDGLIFSRLRPYDNWANFSAEAMRHWRVFLDLTKPYEIQRLGVRFINRIPLPDVSAIPRVLSEVPNPLKSIHCPSREFLCRTSHWITNEPLEITVVQAVQPEGNSGDQQVGLILDLDVFTRNPIPCDDGSVLSHLNKIRHAKNEAFFSMVKPTAIKRFKRSNAWL